MSLNDELTADLKSAMKAHDKESLGVIRLLKAALTNEKVKVGHDLTPDEETTVVMKEYKQRKESIEEFKKGNRDDLVAEQESQLKVLDKYVPEQMSQEEINQVVKDTIAAVGASGKADFGKVMGAVMPKVKGKADGSLVNQAVKELLQ
ncbi:GatB/YqeY domain-containing protein [Nicoliella spurrieriana]|uniref:GatB/YqeY domain-containing protein n=1 Tax=Nicoliella spurrieriana TaxID=2925830 RepID=A0A976X5F3_9LACO|nr:GatB/YqeY domain-containing protein [Nicoliella spurrieriana]UQS86537.1 GatB/YqeY domain-containing protein [Nicoliella spurrieriana]